VLNPVIQKILNEKGYQSLLDHIKDRCGHLIADSMPGISEVKKRYQKWLIRTDKFPVIDSRCPAIVKMIKKEFPELTESLAPIDPILITGAKMRLKEFKDEADVLTIISPCFSFAMDFELDNELKFAKTIITPWYLFKISIDFNVPQEKIENSPVPPGFFNYLGVRVYEASGENECRKLLSNIPDNAQLLELLLCKNGCHKGDGL
jgi:iron only hydrogenase large subunit-like protein